MKYLLNEPFLLRGWQKLPYALVDTRSGLTEFFRRDVMDALLLCDGRQEIPEEGPVRELLEKLERNGVIRPAAPGDSLKLRQLYWFYDNRYIRTAHWSVTGRCNYRCKHCYMSAPDAKFGELSHEQAMDMVRQIID